MVKEGSKAVDFKLKGVDGKTHSLKDYDTEYIVLYFYPKDLTPGCTLQAINYSKRIEKLKELNATVLGVSRDDTNLHKRFKSACKIKFMLLSDPTNKVHKAYGAYGDRGIFGKGTLRNTYIIRKGKVAKIFRRVKPIEDPDNVIKYIKSS